MKFEWDEKKRHINVRKHGFDFVDAFETFNHPMLVQLDSRKDYGEDRWIGTGILKGHVVVVVYVEDENTDTIHIISLRKALSYERQNYEQYFSD